MISNWLGNGSNWIERALNPSDNASDYERLFPLPKESRVLGAPSASAPPQRTSSSRHWSQTIGKWRSGETLVDSSKSVAANVTYAKLTGSFPAPLFPSCPLFAGLGAVALDVATPGAASTVDDPFLPQVRKNVTRCSICCPVAFGLKHSCLTHESKKIREREVLSSSWNGKHKFSPACHFSFANCV